MEEPYPTTRKIENRRRHSAGATFRIKCWVFSAFGPFYNLYLNMPETDKIARLRTLAEKLAKETNPDEFQKLALEMEELINQVLGPTKGKDDPK